MIAKYRKKYIITSAVAVFALLAIVLGVINFVNFAIVSDQADSVLEKLIAEGGAFDGEQPPAVFEPNAQRANPRPIGPNSPELRATTRYFTVTFDADGNPIGADIHMSAVDQAEAVGWARSLLANKQGWTRTYYRYRVWTNETGTHVTIVDQNRELSPSYRVLIASLVGVGVGMVVTLAALIVISKAVVKPIEHSDRRQKRFIADAALEIKNPITVIDANRHLLEERLGACAETQAIDCEVRHLTRLVKGLDELLLLESSNHRRDAAPVDITAMVQQLVGEYQPRYENAGKRLTADIGIVPSCLGDSLEIGELVSICLDNALAYCDTYAEIRLKRHDERILLEISNDAHDIADGQLDSVFECFYRSEQVRSSGIDGAGIQLSIAKQIVIRHGGRIMAEGNDGVFTLRIEL